MNNKTSLGTVQKILCVAASIGLMLDIEQDELCR